MSESCPGRRFRPELLPSLVTAALLPLLIWLGFWQLGRSDEQTKAHERFAAAQTLTPLGQIDGTPAPFQHVVVTGRYDTERQFLIDNITHGGRVGYFVITALAVANSDNWLFVNRGWVPADPARQTLPDIAVDDRPREVRGRVGKLPSSGLALGGAEPTKVTFPAVVVFPTLDELGRWAERDAVLPWALLLDAEDADGYAARDWQPAGLSPARHLGYAVQWFALAITLVVLWFFLSYRKHES